VGIAELRFPTTPLIDEVFRVRLVPGAGAAAYDVDGRHRAARALVNRQSARGDKRPMSTPASDGDVIARSVEDPEAFVTLFERHFHAIHGYLARRVGEGADDLAAEVFAQAFRVRARYRPHTADARPWLYGIAANLLYKHRRTEARRLRALARSRPGADELDLAGAHARADAAALAPRVAAALRAMEARDARCCCSSPGPN
jgi:DNA-directed RNA polymerase specialized sigma24 family protein